MEKTITGRGTVKSRWGLKCGKSWSLAYSLISIFFGAKVTASDGNIPLGMKPEQAENFDPNDNLHKACCTVTPPPSQRYPPRHYLLASINSQHIRASWFVIAWYEPIHLVSLIESS
jgi:hypothetical protein